MAGAVIIDTLDLLLDEGEDAVVRAIHASGGHTMGGIELIVDTLTPVECLQYARTLAEIGRSTEARELVELVLVHASTAPLVPQGAQSRPDEAQTLQ